MNLLPPVIPDTNSKDDVAVFAVRKLKSHDFRQNYAGLLTIRPKLANMMNPGNGFRDVHFER